MVPLIAAALSALAPTLAQQGLDLFSGIFQGAVTKGTEKVAELIQEKTGIEIRDIAENRLTDEQWSKLRDFEAQNKAQILAAYVQLDTNDVERTRIASADRSDARALQVASISKGDQVAQKFVYFYATLITVLTFGFVFWAAFGQDYAANEGSREIVNMVLGFLLGTALAAVVQFFFGSSMGSKSKSDQLSLLNGDKQ